MTTRRYEACVRFNDAACGADDLDVPSAGFLMQCHLALGDTAAAQAAARECVIRAEKALAAEPDTGAPLAYGVIALNVLGETERAKAWTEHALLLDPDDSMLCYNLACAMSQAGDADYALDLLERSLSASGRGHTLWAQNDSDLDPLREHPRYKAIIAAQGARFALEDAKPAA
jgi:adenylate cyclase